MKNGVIPSSLYITTFDVSPSMVVYHTCASPLPLRFWVSKLNPLLERNADQVSGRQGSQGVLKAVQNVLAAPPQRKHYWQLKHVLYETFQREQPEKKTLHKGRSPNNENSITITGFLLARKMPVTMFSFKDTLLDHCPKHPLQLSSTFSS